MSTSAHVLAISALDDLRSGLLRFDAEAREVFEAAAAEIRRTLDWLAERRAYWEREVRLCEQEVARALAVYERCRSAVWRDAQGRTYIPPCIAEGEALRRARARLEAARKELQNVVEWTRRVQQAADEYQRQAQRLAALLEGEARKATALLERSAVILNAYAALAAPSVAALPASSPIPTAAPAVRYETLDAATFARYDRTSDVILINARYQDVREPLLLAPILAHEEVHRRYRGSDPVDEESLQRYVDEEMEAYRAQYEAWQQVKAEFERRYPTAAERMALEDGARDMLAEHLQLQDRVESLGWQGLRQELGAMYRQRMEAAP